MTITPRSRRTGGTSSSTRTSRASSSRRRRRKASPDRQTSSSKIPTGSNITVPMNVDAMSMRLRAEEREEILDEMSVPLAMPRKLSHNTSDTTDDGSRVIGEKVLARGDWLELSQRTYVDPDGASRVWEGCSRLNRTPGSRIDNVMVIAWYRRMLHYDCVVLVKQFR
ncbi:hypothetical protein FOCC_FOCC003112, partial [Frankliniella occidentalis]